MNKIIIVSATEKKLRSENKKIRRLSMSKSCKKPEERCIFKTVRDPKILGGKKRKIFKSARHLKRDEISHFFHMHRSKIGKIIGAEMKHNIRTDKHIEYPFRLIDENGCELWISGLRSGDISCFSSSLFLILKEVWKEMFGDCLLDEHITESEIGKEVEKIILRQQAFTIGIFPWQK